MQNTGAPSVEVNGLVKKFGDVTALNGVSFRIEEGELFGFLGPNGAGKTTTINILTGLARPNEGTVSVGGIDCTTNHKAAQHLIGVVPDESNLYPELTGFDNLCFCAALYGIGKDERRKRAGELLEQFSLAGAGNRKFGGYSKGMKRKLTFAAGMIHRPPIIFLDEPTTGIDVASARQVRQIIADLHRAGTTVLLTTHYIEEAERLCQRIAFIVDGRIVRSDRTSELLKPVQGKNILMLFVTGRNGDLIKGLSDTFPEYTFQSGESGQISVEATGPVDVTRLVKFLDERGIGVEEARRRIPSLEDVFINITGVEAVRMQTEKAGGGQ
jgi:ABC-2 type transport system ATP-binding protein